MGLFLCAHISIVFKHKDVKRNFITFVSNIITLLHIRC